MKKKNENGLIRYIRRTWKNKLAAIALIVIGLMFMNVEGDGTVFVFTLIFGIPLFFTRVNYVG